jgi:excinuclease ABC subunit C
MLDTLLEKANNLPLLPGVYIMLDEHSEVLYVGKAKKLKNRVTSYFRGEHLPKVAAMVDKVRDFNVIVAASEFEALVLENSLIKRHKPHYNILLKDDKGYPFIRIDTKSDYPVMTVSRSAPKDGADYYGPFGGRFQTREIIRVIQNALLLPDCTRKFPRDIGKERPCLKYQMGSCAGWCLEGRDQSDYRARMAQAALILEGKSGELVASLREEMERAAEELRFEAAAALRDRLRAVESLGNRQKVIATAFADTDVIGFFRGAKTGFTVLHYAGGDLAGKDFELLDEPLETDAEAISDLLLQYYARRAALPRTILLPFEAEDADALAKILSETAGHPVRLTVPQRGDKAALTETACLNAKEEVQRATTAQQRRSKTLEWLQKTLQLPSIPRRIEAFDISNTGSFGVVAAMTVFVDGRPLKRDYRKFRMKTVEGQDDFASMHEAVSRRFARCVEGDEKFAEVPDLLLIDGGDRHAAVAEQALAELGLTLPVYGMVKDDRHRTRALVTSGGEEIGISGSQAVFSFIGTVQEETHRFAITYHRALRSKTIGSALEEIPGVGEVRRAALLKAFRTVRAIRAASVEELAAAVPRSTAEAVYAHYHEPEEKP